MLFRSAKAFLRRYKIDFLERNLAEDAAARDELIGLGFRAVPVVCVGNEILVGFSPSKLRKMMDL